MNLATSPALKNVGFENELVIDATGNSYVVERAEKIRKTGKRSYYPSGGSWSRRW